MNVVFLIYAFILFCQQRYSNVLNYNVIYNIYIYIFSVSYCRNRIRGNGR